MTSTNTEELGRYPPAVECPEFGVKLKFNHIFPEKRTQNVRPSFRQSMQLLPLALR